MKRIRKHLAVLSLLLAAILWGGIGTVSKFANQEGVMPEEIAFYRSLIAGLGFLVVALWERRRNPIHTRLSLSTLLVTLGFGVLGVAGLELSNLKAVYEGGAGFAAVFLYSAPLWVTLSAWVFWKEKTRGLKALSLIITISGVAGVGVYGGGDVRFGSGALFWGVISGVSYALFYLYGRVYFKFHSVSELYAPAFLAAALVLYPLVQFHPGKSVVSWAAIGYSGIFATLFAYAAYSYGLKRIDPTRASILCSLEPVVAIASSFWIWGERLSILGYASAAVVITGVSLSAISESVSPREK